eukprot:1159973-Pelagomonas_calceolata.AAC.3
MPVLSMLHQTCHDVNVFEDPELTSSCDEGLNKQLRRTKDGATEQSRIQELAGGWWAMRGWTSS